MFEVGLKDRLTQPIGKNDDSKKKDKKKDKKKASRPAEGRKSQGKGSVGKLSLGKGKARRPGRRNLPVKRSINLASTGVKKTVHARTALPAVVLIIVAAVLLSKFLVVDRLLDMSRAQGEVAALQSQLDADYKRLSTFGEMTDEYAHYTYSNMTAEEMARTDRLEVLDLIQRVVLPQAVVSSWSVSGNILTLDIARQSLQDINLLAQRLNEEPLVNFCTVTTAATKNTSNRNQPQNVAETVTGQIVVYLNSTGKEEEAS